MIAISIDTAAQTITVIRAGHKSTYAINSIRDLMAVRVALEQMHDLMQHTHCC